MPIRRSLTGGRRRKRSKPKRRTTTRRKKTRRTRSRRRSGTTATKSAPIKVTGTFTAYDVANKKKVTMKDPHLIKVKKGSTYRAMIKGKSPLPPHNTVVTFVSTSDSKVSSHFK